MTLIDYTALANDAATTANVPSSLFSSLVNNESGWNPFALGSSGEYGLAQLMPGTAADLGVNQFDPASNLQGGASYLSQLFDQTGNWFDALRAYNVGPATAAANQTAGADYATNVLAGAGVPKDQLVAAGLPVAGIARAAGTALGAILRSRKLSGLGELLRMGGPETGTIIAGNPAAQTSVAAWMDQFVAWLMKQLFTVAALIAALALIWFGLKAITEGKAA